VKSSSTKVSSIGIELAKPFVVTLECSLKLIQNLIYISKLVLFFWKHIQLPRLWSLFSSVFTLSSTEIGSHLLHQLPTSKHASIYIYIYIGSRHARACLPYLHRNFYGCRVGLALERLCFFILQISSSEYQTESMDSNKLYSL
jgi:hypothetical protein